MPLSGRTILLVISGGIAAYKSLDLIRRLRERGARVRCVLTESAKEFVTPLSVAALSHEPAFDDLFSTTDDAGMAHIQLSREADLVVVAPATANLLAKMSAGLADDLASSLLLAADKPVLVAPAMNVRMWHHPATQANLALLEARGIHRVGPAAGKLADGEIGEGRLAEIPDIIVAIENLLAGGGADGHHFLPATPQLPAPSSAEPHLPHPQQTHPQHTQAPHHPHPAHPHPPMADPPFGPLPLFGRHMLVTSGPTHEAIDPVRFIANRSSGKQGHAIAAALVKLGAKVTLVSGPVAIPDPVDVTMVHVESAREMLEACLAALPVDAAVCAAAVADWRVANPAESKIKKDGGGPPTLELIVNPDILATLSAAVQRPQVVVGFAAETGNLIAAAQSKLATKGCDLIVANEVGPETGTFGGDENIVHLVAPGSVESWPKLPKTEVAARLAARIAEMLG